MGRLLVGALLGLTTGCGVVCAGKLRTGTRRLEESPRGSASFARRPAQPAARKTYDIPQLRHERRPSSIDYTEAALADEITNLPGLTQDIVFRHFAGYLDITDQKKIFYWFVESENDPLKDPLVYWTNGGPGCSGLFGFMNENGPFRPTRSGEAVTLNDYAWNKITNTLFVEQPVGVGFSLALDGKLSVTDASTAADNYLVVQTFLEKYPHLRGNDLYLSGESYAGHYVPQLAQLIVEKNEDTSNKYVNLKGFIVGNPLTDPVENMVGMFQAFWGSQLVPHAIYSQWQSKCGGSTEISTFYTQDCVALENQMFGYVAGLNPYALDFPVCLDKRMKGGEAEVHTENALIRAGRDQRFKMRTAMLSRIVPDLASVRHSGPHRLLAANGTVDSNGRLADPYEPCEDMWAAVYLNRADVKEAIHANPNVSWSDCSDQVFFAYSDEDKDVYQEPIYESFVKNGTVLRIMVYSGTDDSVCASPGTQLWISARGWQQQSDWTPWGVNGQVAGYVQKYEGNFAFATVHGAGHEVPAYKPGPALALFNAFIKDSL